MSSDEEPAGLKVVDRRRFDAAGSERDDVGVVQSISNEIPNKIGESRSKGAPSQKSEEPSNEADITFGSFVMSLATQGMVQLGEIPPPPGLELPHDPEAAKQTIDILGMLERKTKQGLDSTETQMLAEILHALRMSYLKQHSGSR